MFGQIYKRCVALLFGILVFHAVLFSQKHTRDFQLQLPGYKTSNSLYKTIRVLDCRVDTTCLGVVQAGALNRKEKVIPQVALSTQLSELMNGITDSSAAQGELLLQLRRLKLSEMDISFHEYGYCYFRASLYAKRDNRYYETRCIDTVIVINALDVTPRLLIVSSQLVVDFIQSSLLLGPKDSLAYSLSNLQRLDSIEKRKLPVYTAAQYKDGIYNSYRSFAAQLADSPVQAKVTRNALHDVRSVNAKGETQKVDRKNIYAVVCNGQPFIATEYDYYPLIKVKDDFYYEGKMVVSTPANGVTFSGIAFGLMGGLMSASRVHTDFFEIKIDHLNGGSIPMVEVAH